MKLIEKIAQDLQLPVGTVAATVTKANCLYKKYYIPKKNGGKREIMQASPTLKCLQYWVKENVLTRLPVSEISFAYEKNNSIKRHALHHVKSNYVLHADICNFFPSIHSSHLQTLLEKRPFIFSELDVDMTDAIDTIGKICFFKDRLCIGTVSSPAIANAVMHNFDNALSWHCQESGYTCSRYADDIYISSPDFIPMQERYFLDALLKRFGFKLNTRKTYFSSKKNSRRVTGIVLTDTNNISIGTARKEQIKKMLYDKLVHGKGDSNEILGHLAFLKDIEPNYYKALLKKYSAYCPDGNIMTVLKS